MNNFLNKSIFFKIIKKQYIKFLGCKVKINRLSWKFAPIIWNKVATIKITPYVIDISNLRDGEQIFILVSNNFSLRPYSVQGADLTECAVNWIEDLIEHQTTTIVTLDVVKSKKSNLLFITYDWMLSFIDGKNILQVLYGSVRLALLLKKNYKNVWVALPDPYYLKVNLLIKILEIKSNNLAIFILQNTRDEMVRYGFKNIISQAFWTWPKKTQLFWQTNLNWFMKDKKILIAKSGGCKKREKLGNKYINIFNEKNYKIIETNFLLPWDEYAKEVKSARYIFTTCFLQDAYLTNSNSYNSKLSKFTITGRVWEAFYVGAVLITNNNVILRELGFFPNVHFIDINEKEIINEIDVDDLFNENVVSQIANNGQKQFNYLLHTKINYDLTTFS